MSVERLRGHATPEGTQRGAESFGTSARELGRTGLKVSPIGFGGYRVRADSALHRRALADALRGGVNLVDTSTNYGDGASEALVGTVMANLVQQGELQRDGVVVVTKVGYVQGSNLARVRGRSDPYPEIVRYRDDLWHCMHPRFIADQLEESLERLGVERIDVLLLHNPEYFLLDAARADPTADAREAYDDRIARAFEALEEQVAAGRISWYGVSSNGFVEPRDDPSFTSVARLVELAERAGGDGHHFGVVQMPMNLLELGAVLRGPLEHAAQAGLGVMINRPLNAFGRGRLVRLVDDPPRSGAADTAAVREALARVRKLEGQWAAGLGKQLVTEDGDDAVDLFRWGQELAARHADLRELEQWQRLRHEVLAPQIGRTSAALLEVLEGSVREAFATWWTRYGAALHEAFETIEAALRSERVARAQAIAAALDAHAPEAWRHLPLSRKAVLTLLATDVSSVLVGMRHPGYVVDMLGLRDPPTADGRGVDFAALERALSTVLDRVA